MLKIEEIIKYELLIIVDEKENVVLKVEKKDKKFQVEINTVFPEIKDLFINWGRVIWAVLKYRLKPDYNNSDDSFIIKNTIKTYSVCKDISIMQTTRDVINYILLSSKTRHCFHSCDACGAHIEGGCVFLTSEERRKYVHGQVERLKNMIEILDEILDEL